ncbi:MAG: ABC transporter ATP-binding protein [Halobacteria archaeon]
MSEDGAVGGEEGDGRRFGTAAKIAGIGGRESVERMLSFDPKTTVGVVVLSVFAAALEGVGIGFILPIVRVAEQGTGYAGGNRFMEFFVSLYGAAGISFTLRNLILGLAIVITLRFIASYMVAYFRTKLRADYVRHLRKLAFENTLDSDAAFFDGKGSDEVMNTIITETKYAGKAVLRTVLIFELSLLCLVYLAVAFYLAPIMTSAAVLVFAVFTHLTRGTLAPGKELGERLTGANEEIQTSVQEGTQGIRDVKLYGVAEEIYRRFVAGVDKFRDSIVAKRRNKAALRNFYHLVTALTVFAMVYYGLRIGGMSIGDVAVFLFAMFRLAPRMSELNKLVYELETDLPHLVKSQSFVEEVSSRREPSSGDHDPRPVEKIEFDSVSFSYDDESVLEDVSFEVETGESVAFVGPSGAGKSTVVSLLARLYEPTEGEIRADGTPLSEIDLECWRDAVAVVRQHPYIFNDTLLYNLTLGVDRPDRESVERACRIARVDDFVDDLPDGYESVLGDDGVRLSGGQKQRVALARALLKDADVLVLDEATSDLDSELEDEVQHAVETARTQYITVTVAHRLSTVIEDDRIYTVEDGEITEVGGHQELIEKEGKYSELYRRQTDEGWVD